MGGNAFKGTVKEKLFKIAFKSFLTLTSVLPPDDSISGHDCYGGVEGSTLLLLPPSSCWHEPVSPADNFSLLFSETMLMSSQCISMHLKT